MLQHEKCGLSELRILLITVMIWNIWAQIALTQARLLLKGAARPVSTLFAISPVRFDTCPDVISLDFHSNLSNCPNSCGELRSLEFLQVHPVAIPRQLFYIRAKNLEGVLL